VSSFRSGLGLGLSRHSSTLTYISSISSGGVMHLTAAADVVGSIPLPYIFFSNFSV